MSLRDFLKQREEAREASAKQSESNFPEGVTRYVKMGRYGEVNAEGRDLVILADPDKWHAYFVHEDSEFVGGRSQHKFQKHTCMHVPGDGDDIKDFINPGTVEQCPTCAAMTKPRYQRRMYFIIPVFDPEYGEFRVIDTKEFHVMNLIKAYDSIERTAKKFQPEYTLVGEVVKFKQDDKTFTIVQSDMDEEAEAEAKEAAKEHINNFSLADQMFMRNRPELVKIIREAVEGSLDPSVVEGEPEAVEE